MKMTGRLPYCVLLIGLVALSGGLAPHAKAAFNVVNWDGSSDNAWATPANWAGDAVPGAGDQANIPAVLGTDVTVNYDSAYYGGGGNPAYLGTLNMAYTGAAADTNTLNISAPLILNPVASGENSSYNAFQQGTRTVVNIDAGGVLQLDGVHQAPLTGKGPGLNIWGTGQMILDGGDLDSEWVRGILVGNTALLRVNAGTLTQYQSTGNHRGIHVRHTSRFELHGGTVNVDRLSIGIGHSPVNPTDEAVGTMTGGVLNATVRGTYIGGTGGGVSGVSSSGRFTVSGGAVTNKGLWIGGGLGTGDLTLSGGVWNQVGAEETQIGYYDTRTSPATPSGVMTLTNNGAFNSRSAVNVGQNVKVGATRQLGEGLLTMDGGTLTITNSAALNVNYGTLALNAGVITADNLDVGIRTTDLGGGNVVSTTGRVAFAGGTLNSKGSTVDNGSLFTVGNGTDAARLNLVSGNHTFAEGLAISAGATLGGAGLITGDVTVDGAVAPGNSVGTLSVEGDVTWNAGDAWVFELGTAGAAIETPGTSDLLAILEDGNFTKGTGSEFTFNFATNTGAVGWYKLVEWEGSSNFSADDFSAENLAYDSEFVLEENALYMNVIPEPGTLGLFGLAALVALLRRGRIRS